MKIRKPFERFHYASASALIYGEPGVGKTVSTLMTAPRPIIYYEIDPKPVERTMWGVVDPQDIEIRHPESFMDIFTELHENYEEIIKTGVKTIVIDPLSHLINVMLLGEIEDESFKAGVFGEKTSLRPLVSMGRTDLAGYGSLASLAKRFCESFKHFVTEGISVICIALLQENPKWNRELVAAPAFTGREFPRDFPAYFDLIGLVESRYNEKGEIIYPPRVRFESDGSFIAKWSGPRKGNLSGPLDWSKILKLPGGEKNNESKNEKSTKGN